MLNFENLSKFKFESDNEYGVPFIKPIDEFEQCEFIGFNFANTAKQRENKGVHFYLDDYQFTRLWQKPDNYINMLSQFKYVLAPDFSMYTDMPLALQLYNHYRKHWLAAYWQLFGIFVIPTICWSTPDSFDWCFDGEPTHSIISVSSVGCMKNKEITKAFINGYNEMIKQLCPTKVLFYGKVPDEINTDNIIKLHSFQSKFDKIKEAR